MLYYRSKQHAALKVLTADCHDDGAEIFELDVLKKINEKHSSSTTTATAGANHIVRLLDHFEHKGPHGTHLCLVFKAMGPALTEYRRLYPLLQLPVSQVKDIARQLLLALAYLHDTCQVIHTGKGHSSIFYCFRSTTWSSCLTGR